MLNVPSEVKALFQRDIVHKNFRAHFPNGETTDINNEDIVAESVVFVESLCSQQYFKFGLAEASSIEFTAVNVPNVRGAVMQCAIEIDVTSLGTTWINNHPVDGSLAFLDPQTVLTDGAYYYRIPYGEFVVDKCPRNHGAMFQRQITAYTPQTDTIQEPGGKILDTMLPYDSQFRPSVKSLVHGSIQSRPALLALDGYTALAQRYVDIALASDISATARYEIYEKDPLQITTRVEIAYRDKQAYLSGSDKNKLYGIELGTMAEAMTPVYAAIRQLDEYGYVAGGTKPSDQILFNSAYACPFMSFLSTKSSTETGEKYQLTKDIPCFYPYRDGEMQTRILMPVELTAYLCDANWNHTDTLWSFDLSTDVASVNVNTYTDSTLTPGITLSYSPTQNEKQRLYITAKQQYMKVSTYAYTNAVSIPDLLQGYLEIMGEFLAPDRTGGQKLLVLSSSSPTSISASDWSEFWWDETPIARIGEIDVSWTDGKEQQTETLVIGYGGGSLYDMTGNAVFNNAPMIAGQVAQILSASFIPRIPAITFTPVDLEMRGLPYLEAGDPIKLTAEDGSIVKSYILRQEISGIQDLRATVTSTNGELMEVEA